MSASDRNPANRARTLLDPNSGPTTSPAALAAASAAAAWATLALVEAVDRQTAVLARLAGDDIPPPGGPTVGPPSQRCSCYGHPHGGIGADASDLDQPCAHPSCACPGLTP